MFMCRRWLIGLAVGIIHANAATGELLELNIQGSVADAISSTDISFAYTATLDSSIAFTQSEPAVAQFFQNDDTEEALILDGSLVVDGQEYDANGEIFLTITSFQIPPVDLSINTNEFSLNIHFGGNPVDTFFINLLNPEIEDLAQLFSEVDASEFGSGMLQGDLPEFIAGDLSITSVTLVPEPTTAAILAASSLALFMRRRSFASKHIDFYAVQVLNRACAD